MSTDLSTYILKEIELKSSQQLIKNYFNVNGNFDHEILMDLHI